MKRFRPYYIFVTYIVLLLTPTLFLSITEKYSAWSVAVSLLLPGGIYLLGAAMPSNVGKAICWSLPLMVICAFQIVILYLFKGSIIAIDMITNLFTTSSTEVGELLYQLVPAIVFVCLLYLPLLAYGGWLWWHRNRTQPAVRRRVAFTGIACALLGTLLMIPAKASDSHYRATHELFPVNVLYNTLEAFRRWELSSRYPQLSQSFRYHPRFHPLHSKEVYILVVGEASRACSWQLNGYDRPTTPLLAAHERLVSFDNLLTESNTTHKSVSMLLSDISALNYDSIYYRQSIVSLFREAGFSTFFLSNQVDNRSFIDYFAHEADSTVRIEPAFDMEGVQRITHLIDHTPGPLFVVFHTYGSHFDFTDRYPHDNAFFTPDQATSVKPENRPQLLNAYDNSIRYTDAVLSALIDTLDCRPIKSALLYCADHGEDVMDDRRNRFLHASPTPTYYQLHVAAFAWFSSSYCNMEPLKYQAAQENRHQKGSSTLSVFHTMTDMAGICCSYLQPSHSLVSPSYRPAPRVYLNDYNEAVSVFRSGITPRDSVLIEQIGNGRSPFEETDKEL